MDVIRYDGSDYIIAKWRSGKGDKRDNAIQLGSSLRVKSGQAAILVFQQEDGKFQDIIKGPFDEELTTKNIPVISKFISLAYHGSSPHQAEVYFVNTQSLIQIRFGIPYFDVFDNEKKEFSVPIAVRGTINVQIKDIEEFIGKFGLRDVNVEEYRKFIMSALTRYVKATITNLPEAANISPLKLEQKINDVNTILEKVVSDRLENEFGVNVSSLDVDAIEVDKKSKDYKDLSKVGKKLSLRNIIHKGRVERLKDDIDLASQASEIALKIIDKIKFFK